MRPFAQAAYPVNYIIEPVLALDRDCAPTLLEEFVAVSTGEAEDRTYSESVEIAVGYTG
jgi:hypothetical protein